MDLLGLREYLDRQKAWSEPTFGTGLRTGGLTKHIEKELAEIRKAPTDVLEWIDVIILALDGAWRCSASTQDVVDALAKKQDVNLARKWPPPGPEDVPNEHIRT